VQLERELKRFVRQIRPGLIGATSNPNVNLAQLIEDLKTIPDARRELSQNLKELLTTRDFIQALTETGLTLESGVFSEVYKRIEYKFLPKAHDHNDVLNLIGRVFDSRSSDAGWLEKVDRELFAEFLGLILPSREELIEALAPQLLLSLEILSLRLAGLGYDPLVTHRLKGRREFQYSFMEVTRHVHGLIDGKGSAEESIEPIRKSLKHCAMAVNWIRSRRHIDGASLGLTYRLMKVQQIVHRMDQVLDLLDSVFGEWTPKPALDLFVEITLAEIQRFNLTRFIGHNMEMLAYQITEHAGKAGEHYITKSRDEWVDMFRSAAIGGVIVALLAVLKVLIAKIGLPPIPEAVAFGTLYASGFVFILYIGGTLATKQPAMTASTLAQALDEATTSKQAMENLSEVLIRTSRSQFAALLGNFMVAFPAAVFFSLPFYFSNHDLMSPEKATQTLESLHPFKSLSFWYAAVAGLGLFLSGLLAGFADNWFIFNNVGYRLRQAELLKKLVGPHNLDRAIKGIDHNLGFWIGNISLGYYLGMMGAIGVIMGLPIDTRHITFSTATFGAALVSLKFQYSLALIALLAVSIFFMGLINLTVSFTLSLTVAVKSRRIKFSQTPDLLRLLGQKFRKRPMEFFVPPRDVE
jgi:site-specific recombinase